MSDQKVKIRGELPAYKVRGLKRSNLGVYTGTILVHRLVGSKDQRIQLAWLDPSAVSAPWSIPCVDSDAKVLDNGLLEITFTYEGVDPENPPSLDNDDDVTYEMDASMAEESIETHPKFADLAKSYGWDKDLRQFASTLAKTVSSTGNALSSAQSGGTANPLYGTDSWLVAGVVFRRSYVTQAVPSSALEDIGAIVNRPPNIGAFRIPGDMKKRNWLKLGPKIVKTGNAATVSEEWMLSGPGGWKSQIYSAGQLG